VAASCDWGEDGCDVQKERALQTRRKAEWCAERPAVVLTSHSISGSHRCQDAAHFTTILRSYRRQTPSARKRSPEKPTPLQASTAQGSLSSMLAGSQTASLCRDVVQAGPAFIPPSQQRSGARRGGTGASLASSHEAFWLPFLLSGSAWFS
jgi:hypothetical protein